MQKKMYAFQQTWWSGGAKVLGKLPVPGRPTILITVGQGPTALAVGAGGGCLDIFTHWAVSQREGERGKKG